MYKAIGSLALLLLLVTTGRASGETFFTATIDGEQAGTPSNAMGTGTFTLRDDNVLEYEVVFDALPSDEIGAHFHGPADIGQPAGVVFPLPLGSPKNGTVGPLSQQQRADLLAGLWYVNIHSNQYPGGEIRGQVLQTPVSTESDRWGEVKARFGGR